ncbi:uncharacterized protein DUF3828 [Buttiauxella sp. JUb87]|uniref:DUF3828 domain-containing protein n=1 Tax=Buttiauxella sp. JUb87 TaxID=2485129 RepID=UPI0010E325C5|nr:DUF3828 domain-containing protein [Buttiauxella sp. JUb87]TDN54843.1 uncharacterized protein DUF3828 [Buttiauxella sp. JUb87]
MLKKITLLCCLFCLPYMALASNEKNISPEEVVSEFYHDYLVAAEMPDMESADDLTMKAIFKYTTEHLRALRDNDDSGADYFVDAQDICEEWKSSIYTKSVSENDHDAQVNLKLGYGKGASLYVISLMKIKGKWLVDSVKLTSRNSVYCPRQSEGEE